MEFWCSGHSDIVATQKLPSHSRLLRDASCCFRVPSYSLKTAMRAIVCLFSQIMKCTPGLLWLALVFFLAVMSVSSVNVVLCVGWIFHFILKTLSVHLKFEFFL